MFIVTTVVSIVSPAAFPDLKFHKCRGQNTEIDKFNSCSEPPIDGFLRLRNCTMIGRFVAAAYMAPAEMTPEPQIRDRGSRAFIIIRKRNLVHLRTFFSETFGILKFIFEFDLLVWDRETIPFFKMSYCLKSCGSNCPPEIFLIIGIFLSYFSLFLSHSTHLC